MLYYNTQKALAKAEDEMMCQNEIKCIESQSTRENSNLFKFGFISNKPEAFIVL